MLLAVAGEWVLDILKWVTTVLHVVSESEPSSLLIYSRSETADPDGHRETDLCLRREEENPAKEHLKAPQEQNSSTSHMRNQNAVISWRSSKTHCSSFDYIRSFTYFEWLNKLGASTTLSWLRNCIFWQAWRICLSVYMFKQLVTISHGPLCYHATYTSLTSPSAQNILI